MPMKIDWEKVRPLVEDVMDGKISDGEAAAKLKVTLRSFRGYMPVVAAMRMQDGKKKKADPPPADPPKDAPKDPPADPPADPPKDPPKDPPADPPKGPYKGGLSKSVPKATPAKSKSHDLDFLD